MADKIAPYDPTLAAALAGLEQYVDQRPSASGFMPSIFEVDRLTSKLVNVVTEEAHDSMLVVPVMLRETRNYWARKGTGEAPDCSSIDGIKPRHGPDLEPQAETCNACPWNKFGTAENGGGGKKCKTRGILFAIRLGADGKLVEPVVIRTSLGNRSITSAILAADRKSAEAGVPRALSIWKLSCAVERAKKEGQQDYIYLKPEFSGAVKPEDAQRVVDVIKELGPDGGADRFLSGLSAGSSE